MDDIQMFKTKKWYQSRVIWLALGQAVVAVLVAIKSEFPEADLASSILLIKSILDIMYRVDTKNPIS